MIKLDSNWEKNVGWIVLLVLLAGCLLVMLPFMSALLWAVVLSFSTWPIYRRLLKLLRGRRTLAALVMSASMILTVLLPFVIVGATLADNVTELTDAVRNWLAAGTPPPPEWLGGIPLVGQRAHDYWQSLSADSDKLLHEAQKLLEPMGGWLLKIGWVLGNGIIELALSIFIAFFLFRDGASAAERLTNAVERIGGERGKHLLTVAGNTVRGVVYGILGTALVQALIAGVGFWIAGVPAAGLLALLTFFLSVLPVGPPLVWVPAALWLFQNQGTGWGIFMLVWGVGVSSVDNVVKPWLISQGSDMPFLLIFFGALGGALAFGFIGVFIGPTLLAVAYRLIVEWASSRSQNAPGNSLGNSTGNSTGGENPA
jgi:predicted PurR-regulated permease PerM